MSGRTRWDVILAADNDDQAELRSIRRGAGGLEPTAASAVQASSFAARRALAWAMAVGILVALVLFALLTDVIG